MTILAVDLAAKHSAVCVMDDDYTIVDQFDSFGQTEDEFLQAITGCWDLYLGSEHEPDIMVVEDLPHGLSYSTLVKTVCRIQGRLVQMMRCGQEDILFLAPATWREHHDLKRGTGPNAVFGASERLGYRPPDLTGRTKGKGGRSKASKIESDYCAAFLIATWAIDTKKTHGTYDVPGTSRYATTVIRKKDFDAKDDSSN